MYVPFLRALYNCFPHGRGVHERKSTLSICRMFNERNTYDTRRALLRTEWERLGLPERSVNSVEQVLKSCVGTVFPYAGGEYTLTRVSLRGIRFKPTHWMFVQAGFGREAFLIALRQAMDGLGPLSMGELFKLVSSDAKLDELAMSCRRNEIDCTTQNKLMFLLHSYKYQSVEGYALVQLPDTRWLFVPRA